MTHYIGVVASLAIRRSPASIQPANLLLNPARAPRIGARGRVHCGTPALQGFAQRFRMPIAATFDPRRPARPTAELRRPGCSERLSSGSPHFPHFHERGQLTTS
jgi:hypothetical protein